MDFTLRSTQSVWKLGYPVTLIMGSRSLTTVRLLRLSHRYINASLMEIYCLVQDRDGFKARANKKSVAT